MAYSPTGSTGVCSVEPLSTTSTSGYTQPVEKATIRACIVVAVFAATVFLLTYVEPALDIQAGDKARRDYAARVEFTCEDLSPDIFHCLGDIVTVGIVAAVHLEAGEADGILLHPHRDQSLPIRQISECPVSQLAEDVTQCSIWQFFRAPQDLRWPHLA